MFSSETEYMLKSLPGFPSSQNNTEEIKWKSTLYVSSPTLGLKYCKGNWYKVENWNINFFTWPQPRSRSSMIEWKKSENGTKEKEIQILLLIG